MLYALVSLIVYFINVLRIFFVKHWFKFMLESFKLKQGDFRTHSFQVLKKVTPRWFPIEILVLFLSM